MHHSEIGHIKYRQGLQIPHIKKSLRDQTITSTKTFYTISYREFY